MTTHFLQQAGGKIAYEIRGNGPLVVCVPGMGDLRGEYRFLLDQLAAAGYRAAALDVRGHGETSPHWQDYSVAGIGSDILALIRHLGGEPAVIIGTSMAAAAAVWAAAEAPEAVRAIVMVGPFVRGGSNLLGKVLAATLFTRPWGPAMWARYFNGLFPTRKPADHAAYVHALKTNLTQPGRNEALQAMLSASKDSAEARLPRVQAPALVLMGSKDPDFKDPAVEARWVAEQVRGQVHLIEGAGHYPHAEMPERTAPVILAFLAALSAETRQPAQVLHAG